MTPVHTKQPRFESELCADAVVSGWLYMPPIATEQPRRPALRPRTALISAAVTGQIDARRAVKLL